MKKIDGIGTDNHRFLHSRRELSIDDAWDMARNYYGYGIDEATKDGMEEYASYLSNTTQQETRTPTKTDPMPSRKELARTAFARSYRTQDHATGRGRGQAIKHHAFVRDAFDGRWLPNTYKNNPLPDDNPATHLKTEPYIMIEPTEEAPRDMTAEANALKAYAEWLEENGLVSTTSNLATYFGITHTSESEIDEIQDFQEETPPKQDLHFGPDLFRPDAEDDEEDQSDPYGTWELRHGVYDDLFAKLYGLRSSEARRAATRATYEGGHADDDPIDWHDSYIIR